MQTKVIDDVIEVGHGTIDGVHVVYSRLLENDLKIWTYDGKVGVITVISSKENKLITVHFPIHNGQTWPDGSKAYTSISQMKFDTEIEARNFAHSYAQKEV